MASLSPQYGGLYVKESEFSTRTGKMYFMRAEPQCRCSVDAIIDRETHVYDLAFTFFLT